MPRRHAHIVLLSLIGLLPVGFAWAQEAEEGDAIAGSWAWRPLLTHEGVEFTYLYHEQEKEEPGSVVVRLHNRNDHAVRYEFTVIFRSGDLTRVGYARGMLRPGEQKTGEGDGLFWMPFEPGRSLGELGLRGYRVERIEDSR